MRAQPSARRVRLARTLVRAVAASTAVVVLVALPALSQTEEDVEQAREETRAAATELRRVEDQLDMAVGRYQEIVGQVIELEDALADFEFRQAMMTQRRAELTEGVRNGAAQLYMDAISATTMSMFLVPSLENALVAGQAIGRSSEAQDAQVADLTALTAEMERSALRRAETLAALRPFQAEAEALVVEMDLLFIEAEAAFSTADQNLHEAENAYQAELDRQRRAEADRRRQEAAQTSNAPSDGTTDRGNSDETSEGNSPGGGGSGLACPLVPVSFTDDWGAPRSGGRQHQGTDLFAPYGRQVMAVTDGVVRTRRGGIGGITIWLTGGDGSSYYYAHLSGWADGISTGVSVRRGQVIGFNGNSGNAAGSAPHVHFQIHPGGGSPVNPFPTLRQACR